MADDTQRSEEDIAREIAEQAKPGWKAVSVTRGRVATGADAARFDVQGLDMDALKLKYFGQVRDGRRGPALRTNEDVHFVSMVPEVGTDAPIRERKVIVSGNKVSGFQG